MESTVQMMLGTSGTVVVLAVDRDELAAAESALRLGEDVVRVAGVFHRGAADDMINVLFLTSRDAELAARRLTGERPWVTVLNRTGLRRRNGPRRAARCSVDVGTTTLSLTFGTRFGRGSA